MQINHQKYIWALFLYRGIINQLKFESGNEHFVEFDMESGAVKFNNSFTPNGFPQRFYFHLA